MAEGKHYDILLAHPDEVQRTHFEEVATTCDFARVVSVDSARAAVDVLSRTPFDALACPIELGDIDVWRLARMVRSGDYGSISLPIIVVCDHPTAPIVDALAKEHDVHLVDLSWKITDLGERVTHIIDGRSKHSVLIIEDDEKAAQVAALALDKAYDVEVSHNGEEGLRAWRERQHDIVLLDVMLPGLSGPEVLPQILADNPEQAVIVMTAYASRERHEELVFAGAAEFLAKPFDINQLTSTCDRVLQNHRLVETLHATQNTQASHSRLASGARIAGYKLSQGLAGEADAHLRSALAGLDNTLSDDDWSQLLSDKPLT
ncbi:MAG: response regulator [Pseudomonadales bacterium]